MKLQISTSEGEPFTISLEKRRYSVGRGEESDLRLEGKNVSRHHAWIIRENDDVTIGDESRYGTIVNGEKISTTTALTPGDRIQVGDYLISLESESDIDAEDTGVSHADDGNADKEADDFPDAALEKGQSEPDEQSHGVSEEDFQSGNGDNTRTQRLILFVLLLTIAGLICAWVLYFKEPSQVLVTDSPEASYQPACPPETRVTQSTYPVVPRLDPRC